MRAQHDSRHALFPIRAPHDRAAYDAARRRALEQEAAAETARHVPRKKSVEHLDVTCRGCAQTPLLGVRHRCVVCEGQRAVVTVVVGR